ncbi:MAG: YggS family pyridoxal phosphate-dependent enzyme [Victivallaceae bacterium]|nr:YggS family pyridoxal phosphate-dependent enzyme [Victivallaceae bacterium]
MSELTDNFNEVAGRVARAAALAGRPEGAVRLVAVSKTFPAADIAELYRAGVRRFGESRASEFVAKADALPADIEWHFIGHLQANKVRPVAERAAWIHSVDSLKLAERIDRIAGECGKRPKILFEVNVSGEASKFGMSPAELAEAACAGFGHVEAVGLMTMAPAGAPEETLEAVFGALAELGKNYNLKELSMGMSGDFEAAVKCGATLVRVGSLIFGKREYL